MNKQYYVKDNKFIIKYKDKEYIIPKPFDQCYFGADPTKEMTIGNRFNDESGQGQFARLILFNRVCNSYIPYPTISHAKTA